MHPILSLLLLNLTPSLNTLLNNFTGDFTNRNQCLLGDVSTATSTHEWIHATFSPTFLVNGSPSKLAVYTFCSSPLLPFRTRLYSFHPPPEKKPPDHDSSYDSSYDSSSSLRNNNL